MSRRHYGGELDYGLGRLRHTRRFARGGDGQEVEWVEADPARVLEMLHNPKYAGIYVHGRRRTLTEMTPSGEVRKRVVRVSQQDWQTVIHDHHPAYLTVEEYDRNQNKLAAFDRDEPHIPTPEQQQQLQELGADLERAWFHPRADPRLQKQIVRTLVTHAYADVDEDRDEGSCGCTGRAAVTRSCEPPRRARSGAWKPESLRAAVHTPRKVSHDEAIAQANGSRL